MSNTGGGHRASAEALRDGFIERYGDQVQVDIIDLLMEHLPWPLNWLPHTYPFLIQDAAWLWKLLWQTGRHPVTIRHLSMIVARWGETEVAKVFASYAPDLIISVHPLVQEFSLRALRRMRRRVPFVTVVTDLATAHPLWFHPAVDACYVASKEAYQRARRVGLRAEQLHLYGLPIRPVFAKPTTARSVLRQTLGMDAQLPAVLIVSGGEGVGPIQQVAEQINTQLVDQGEILGQMVIICGRNGRLQERLAAQRWAIPVQIRGFVNNMDEWMAACDCIVTKAGPGTIAEALSSGLPIILSGFIPGQEEGNIPYVLDNHVGVYNKTPQAIAQTVRQWFDEENEEFTQMKLAVRVLGRPQATLQIVESIGELLLLEGLLQAG
jgi:1,2-diacylglycerol 3-beta-galactosyltransferase